MKFQKKDIKIKALAVGEKKFAPNHAEKPNQNKETSSGQKNETVEDDYKEIDTDVQKIPLEINNNTTNETET